jgi:hypothetical protein
LSSPLPNLDFVSDATKNSSLNDRLSDDLTVVFLRGNGSPRTFRLSVPALQRSLTGLGFAFAFAVAAALLLLLWNLLRFTPDRVDLPFPAPTPVAPAARPVASDAAGGEAELRKELQGLREDNAKLAAEANGRHDLANGVNAGLLQFFGPKNVAEANSPIEVKNVKVSRSGATIAVDFEVTNTDPEQRQVRGYIVVLAKTASTIVSYPEGVFNPDQNIVLDFSKGETFGVSRLRPTRATFPADALEGKRPRFEILLFSTTGGKVLADLHVEGS